MPEPHKVSGDSTDMRLDRWFLKHYPGLTKGTVEKLLRTGQVRVNKGRKQADYRLQEHDEIRIPPQLDSDAAPPPKSQDMSKADRLKWQKVLPSMILFENDDIIALNKPAGLSVQGGSKIATHVDMLLPLLAKGKEVPRLVHRLDRQTSGVLLLAKNRASAEAITADFKARKISKLYWAIVQGVPTQLQGHIAVAISKKSKDGFEQMQADDTGDMAETLYTSIENNSDFSWLACAPLSGRTHQIRLHLSHIGTPILGDRKYGGKEVCSIDGDPIKRIYLHARSVQYRDITITAPADKDFTERLQSLGFDANKDSSDNFLRE